MLKLATPLALLALWATPTAAQTGPADIKVNQVIVYGDDPCPPGTDDTIVVCARRSENDRFRVPESLRGVDPTNPENDAWANKAEQLQYVGRSGIQSCTPSGIGGATGCFAELVRQARAERAQGDGTDWANLVAAARAERVGRIDADSDEIEAQVRAEEAARQTPQ